MAEKLTKEKLSRLLGISRPTLDKYLKYGFPTSYKYDITEDNCYRRIQIENEINILEYKLSKLKEELKILQEESDE